MPQYKKVFDIGTYTAQGGYHRIGYPTYRIPGPSGQQVPQSIRSRGTDNGNNITMTRWLDAAGSNQKATISFWAKRAKLSGSDGYNDYPYAVRMTGSNYFYVGWSSDDTFTVSEVVSTSQYQVSTNLRFMDTTRWYHVVVGIDTTQATAANRVKIYVDGVQVTSLATATYPSLNYAHTYMGTTSYIHSLTWGGGAGTYYGGQYYLSEYYYIDGQQLTASSFGETNSDGIWVPKLYSGSFGTAGFYLPFSNSTNEKTALYDLRSGSYSTNLCTDGTSSSDIGNATYLSLAFDGKAYADYGSNQCPYVVGSGLINLYVGKDWGSGVTKTITAFRVFGSSDYGFASGGSSTMTLKLQGSNDNSTWTDLYTNSTLPNTAYYPLKVTSGITTTTAYRYHRVQVYENSPYGASHVVMLAELEFYVAGSYNIGNNWVPSALNVTTANTTYDIMLDSPTDYLGTSKTTANNSGNFCTININKLQTATGTGGYSSSIAPTFSKGSLRAYIGAAPSQWANPTQYFGSVPIYPGMKVYFEATLTWSGYSENYMGFGTAADYVSTGWTQQVGFGPTKSSTAFGFVAGNSGGASSYFQAYSGGTNVFNMSNPSSPITAMFAIDLVNGKVYTGYNGTWGNTADPTIVSSASTTLAGGIQTYWPWFGFDTYTNGTAQHDVNFGQRAFTYTIPSGYTTLNMYNVPKPTVSDSSLWYYGDVPDMIWIKNRSVTSNNSLTNSIRGVGLSTTVNGSIQDQERGNPDISEMNKWGMTLIGSSSSTTGTNTTAHNFVYWAQKAGGSSTVTNTSGSITSQVSANPATGFSIVTYTGTGANGTVGHGLGAVPSFYFCRSTSSGVDFQTYHISLGGTGFIKLNSSAAGGTAATVWNSTTPTSSVFSLGSAGDANSSGYFYVAYCWAPIAGYSAFGSYTGNGSADGPFVYLGFRPKWIMWKRSDSTGSWWISDSARQTYNPSNAFLYSDSNNAEASDSNGGVDFLSNGFKSRCNASAAANYSGATYIYAAFAEIPFKYARAR